MNLLLQDPFSVLKEYPETLTDVIESPLYTVIQRFSPRGDYLAIGCVEGTVLIYDMDTLKPVKVLGHKAPRSRVSDAGGDSVPGPGLDPDATPKTECCEISRHTQAIQSIQWSKNGRYILTSSRDCAVKLWDLDCSQDAENREPCACETFQFETFVWIANFLPGDKQCVACVFNKPLPFVIDFATKEIKQIVPFSVTETTEHATPVFEDAKKYGNCITSCVFEGSVCTGNSEVDSTQKDHTPNQTTTDKNVEKVLKTNIILTGTSKGWLSIYEVLPDNSHRFVRSTKVASSSIKNIIVSEAGNLLCINAADRTIRQYSLSLEENDSTESPSCTADKKDAETEQQQQKTRFELHFLHKYQDVINKLQWNSIFFSPNYGEYLVASTHGSSAHDIYLWETNNGFLVRVLEDAGEELLNIDWNYRNMTIVSNGLETGNVYNWNITVAPKWSALAPDFEEVEENVKYMEREDEFDEYDEENERNDRNKLEEVDIDLVTREKFDVRGNDIATDTFVIPQEYHDIVQIQNTR